MVDIVIIAVLLVIFCGAAAYIVKAKKKGTKCIGCPAGDKCIYRKGNGNEKGCHCECSGNSPEK